MKNLEFYSYESLENLFDEFETCLMHIKKFTCLRKNMKDYYRNYAKDYSQEAKEILEAMRAKPKDEKLRFVIKLIKRENLADLTNDNRTYKIFHKYVNFFWKKVIDCQPNK